VNVQEVNAAGTVAKTSTVGYPIVYTTVTNQVMSNWNEEHLTGTITVDGTSTTIASEVVIKYFFSADYAGTYPVQLGSIKFDYNFNSPWPFASASNFLQLNLQVKTPFATYVTNKVTGGTELIFDVVGEQNKAKLFIPAVAVADGVNGTVTYTITNAGGGIVNIAIVCPSYTKTLLYDPVAAIAPLGAVFDPYYTGNYVISTYVPPTTTQTVNTVTGTYTNTGTTTNTATGTTTNTATGTGTTTKTGTTTNTATGTTTKTGTTTGTSSGTVTRTASGTTSSSNGIYTGGTGTGTSKTGTSTGTATATGTSTATGTTSGSGTTTVTATKTGTSNGFVVKFSVVLFIAFNILF